MKKLFAISSLLAVLCSRAQDCKNFYFLRNNKLIEMSIYDKKGDVGGKLLYSISDVTNSEGFTTATVQSQMLDKKGKTIAKGSSVMKCNGGIMMINMKMSIPLPQSEQFSHYNAKADDFYIEYPTNMKKGDQLKNGNLTIGRRPRYKKRLCDLRQNIFYGVIC